MRGEIEVWGWFVWDQPGSLGEEEDLNLPVEVGCQNPVRVRPWSATKSVFPGIGRKMLFFPSKFLHCLTPHTNAYFSPFQFSFFFFPWIISHISCDNFKQGLMLHSCNISLILKDQGNTFPAQLLQSLFIHPQPWGWHSLLFPEEFLAVYSIIFLCRGEKKESLELCGGVWWRRRVWNFVGVCGGQYKPRILVVHLPCAGEVQLLGNARTFTKIWIKRSGMTPSDALTAHTSWEYDPKSFSFWILHTLEHPKHSPCAPAHTLLPKMSFPCSWSRLLLCSSDTLSITLPADWYWTCSFLIK